MWAMGVKEAVESAAVFLRSIVTCTLNAVRLIAIRVMDLQARYRVASAGYGCGVTRVTNKIESDSRCSCVSY